MHDPVSLDIGWTTVTSRHKRVNHFSGGGKVWAVSLRQLLRVQWFRSPSTRCLIPLMAYLKPIEVYSPSLGPLAIIAT